MGKRGMTSAFVIIGLLLVFIVAFIITLDPNSLRNEGEEAVLFTQTKESLKDYVTGCVHFTVLELKEKLWVVDDPELVEDYLKDHYMDCIDDFKTFKEKEYNVNYQTPAYEAEFIGNNLFVYLDFPIELSKAEQKTSFEAFEHRELDYKKVEIPEGFEMIYRNIIYKEDDYITEEGFPVHYYVVKIALRDPGTSFLVTPHQTGLQPAIDFQRQQRVQIAINGDQWPWPPGTVYSSNADVAGLAASLGDLYAERPEDSGEVPIFISEDNEVSIGKRPNVVYNAISGSTTLVVKGDVNAKVKDKGHPDHKDGYETRRPRTSIGLDEENEHLVLVISVGDTGDMPGLNFRELAYILLENQASHAINMDGGGSSSLIIENKGGIVYTAELGGRPVANHLGIYGTPYSVTTG